ncbi:MAG: DUF6265 family protein [Pseudomonadota bacterium]
MRALWTSLATGSLVLGTPIAAEEPKLETRVVESDFESPAAKADQLDWLIGSWSGPGVRDALAQETSTAPVGGTMVGTFIQQNADGSIMFTELMYIRPVGESLEMAIKHFNPDLTSWEEKDEVERFRLVALEPCAAFFQTLTVRCADPQAPGEGLVVAVRSGSDEAGNTRELVFRYRPRAGSDSRLYDCDGTTIELNDCLAGIRNRAEAREKLYFETALGEGGFADEGDAALRDLMRSSQSAAEKNREQECGAVYEFWKEGTIHNAMSLRCSIRLIDQRTHVIWRNWLTFQDSSAPILPEPEPSR